ncbi:MAG TPA: hypothetical protein VHN99_02700, partial [Deinococcales bacterium]|nr:hypothetical protein [Deinococcales bacterium]
MRTVHVIGATLALSLAAAPAGAQTLAQLASPGTLLTLEMANFAQARQLAPGLFKDMAKINLASGLGLSAAEKRQMTDALSLADRDAVLAVSLDAKGNPHFLAAAKVPAAASKTVTAMINDATASARKNHEVIQKVRAGSFGYTLTTARGGDTTAFGFESGMVYVSDHAATLGDFLRNASGKGTNGSLGKQAKYA